MLDYLYDDLGLRKQKAFKKHLQVCAKCSKELAAHEDTVSIFHGLPMEEPPEGIEVKMAAIAAIVDEEAERRERARARTPRYWRPALAAAAAAALVVTTVVYYLPRAASERMAARKSQVAWQGGEVSEQPKPAAALSKDGAFEGEKGARAYKAHKVDFGLGATSDSLGNEVSRSEIATEEYRGRDLKYSAPAMASPAPAAERPLARRELRSRTGEASAQLPADEEVVAGSISAPAKIAESQDVLSGAKEPAKQEPDIAAVEEAPKEQEAKDRAAKVELAEGNAYFDRLDYDQAATHYERVIDLEAQEELTAEARYRLGQSYQEMKQWEKAVAAYEEIIKNEPDSPELGEVYIAVGECYLAMGRTEDALHSFETVRDRFPALRELALEKIDLAVSQQKKTERANQPPPP